MRGYNFFEVENCDLKPGIVKQADKTIVLIDGYVDIVTLNILAKKKKNSTAV